MTPASAPPGGTKSFCGATISSAWTGAAPPPLAELSEAKTCSFASEATTPSHVAAGATPNLDAAAMTSDGAQRRPPRVAPLVRAEAADASSTGTSRPSKETYRCEDAWRSETGS